MLMIQCPVSVIYDEVKGEPIIVVDPDDRAIAEDNAQYGCRNCDAHISVLYEGKTECQTVPQ